MEKYCRVRQATDGTMGHAHCMLDNECYKHTFGACYTYCFSTTTTKILPERASLLRYIALPVLCI
jgi:hypothetical protein